ncbi:MAG TPA: TIGR01777 family oxidoreductase [Jiangellaceae bacterium]
MTIRRETEMAASIDEVFGWHERPGAVRRLMPRWQPVTVLRESASLRDGTAVLGLPGGLRWSARHQPGDYDPPHRFADELVTAGLGPALAWRHVHEFEEAGTATRVIDTVDSRAPRFLVEPVLRYRHAQLAAELASLERSRQWSDRAVTIAITGSSGLIGSVLTALLTTSGHSVIRLVRRTPRAPDERQWNPMEADPDLLSDVDAVIHLAGEHIGGRFSERHRRELRDSRVTPTRLLAESAVRAERGPQTFVSASGIGYYGYDRGDEILAEDSDPGDGFVAELVRDWEAAAAPAKQAAMRVVQIRTGIVQDPRGGALQILYPVFWAGLGGRLGDGTHWMSWIGLDDLLDIYRRAVLDDSLYGPVNAVAPEPVRNADYSRTLAKVLHRPAIIPTPRIGPRILVGEQGSRELAYANQRVRPARLESAGHVYRYRDLGPALSHVLGRD